MVHSFLVYLQLSVGSYLNLGFKMGEIVPYFLLALCVAFGFFALYQAKQLDKA